MVNNADEKCGFEHEIVSYMYNELGAAEQIQFETHLVDCSSCTAEFAAVSLSRFSVFEWQKNEFAHLATPEIVIPYKRRKVVASKAGWFAGFIDAFTFVRSPLAVGAAFAVVLAIGLIGFNFVRRGAGETGSNNIIPAASLEKFGQEPNSPTPPVLELGKKPAEDEVRPVKASSRDIRPRVPRQMSLRRVTEARSTPNPASQARRAPVLGDLADDEVDSLRLADMLDGIGG